MKPESGFIAEVGIVFWLEKLLEQLMTIGISVSSVPELIPSVPCTVPSTHDASCLISE